jgi:hypothetical protein
MQPVRAMQTSLAGPRAKRLGSCYSSTNGSSARMHCYYQVLGWHEDLRDAKLADLAARDISAAMPDIDTVNYSDGDYRVAMRYTGGTTWMDDDFKDQPLEPGTTLVTIDVTKRGA